MIDLKMVTDATGKIMDSARTGNRKQLCQVKIKQE